MNYTDAQNLLGVPRYVSQIELRKKYIALIKIHHPDVNADKKRANKLTSDIIEAYEVFLKHRDQEKWKEKDTETKTANGSFGNNRNANHRSQPEENYGIWEKQSKQTPLSKNPFWQSTFVSNFDFTPECFRFIGLTTRFPSEPQVKEAFNKEIDSHHPRRFANSQESFDRCRYISLAYYAVCNIRDTEEWCQVDYNRKYKVFEEEIDVVEEEDKTRGWQNNRNNSNKKRNDTRQKSSPKSVGNTLFDRTNQQQKKSMVFMASLFGITILFGVGFEGCQNLLHKNTGGELKGDSRKKSERITKSEGLNEILKLSFIKSTITQIIETEMRKVLKSNSPFVRKLNLNDDGIQLNISDALHGGGCVVVFKATEIPISFSFFIATDILVQDGRKYSSSKFHVEWSVPEILGVTTPSTHTVDLGPFVR